jgi:hypothetical protein
MVEKVCFKEEAGKVRPRRIVVSGRSLLSLGKKGVCYFWGPDAIGVHAVSVELSSTYINNYRCWL